MIHYNSLWETMSNKHFGHILVALVTSIMDG